MVTAHPDAPPTQLAWGHAAMIGLVMIGTYMCLAMLLHVRHVSPVGPMVMVMGLTRWIADAPQRRLDWGALLAIALGAQFALLQFAIARP
jgi:hypothetical protein